MPLSAGTRLGRYEIVSPLGAGGMGEVYRATDARLGREVAIKVLPEHLSKDQDALARFEREARAVAAFSHPNILAIHDVGSDGGVAFAVTELLEGETLRSRLSASGLPWRKTIEIAAAVADGLSLAHSKGIVHRDLKPENIFLTSDGRVKILDFGLARWVPVEPAENGQEAPTETQSGTIAGTIGYMSPEQVRGLAAGAPSDIFSLGCVLYEMVVGRRAFGKGPASDVLAAILRDDPAPLSECERSCPPELEHVVMHCLEKHPAERFQSARDLAFALRAITGSGRSTGVVQTPMRMRRLHWIGTAALLLLVAAAVLTRLSHRSGPVIGSLAVLPFANASGDPNTEYISDGLTESLIDNLSRIPKVTVKSRNSVFRYKGKETDAQQAGHALKVEAVLTGRVAQRGQDLSVSAELVQVKDNGHIWGEHYNRKVADILSVQEEISREIASKLHARLSGDEQQRVTKRYTDHSEAYALYLQALYQRRRLASAETLTKAIDYGRKALELDPAFARVHALLADIYNVQGAFVYGYGVISPQESAAKARAEALTALKIDDTLADAHATLALVAMQYDWDWPAAGQEFRRALTLDPNSGYVHHWYSHYLTSLGQVEESLKESKRALELEPLDLGWNAHLAWHYMYARQYDAALNQLLKTLEMEPNSGLAHWYIGLVYEQKQMWQDAITHLRKAVILRNTQPSTVLLLGHAYAASGDKEQARKALAQANEMRRQKYVSSYGIASIYTALGESDRAFEWLETAVRERDSWMNLLKVDPRFDPLRSDPRFQQLLRRVGL